MATLLIDHVARKGDDTALRDDHVSRTWRELDERVNRWVDVLAGHGLDQGDRVACVLGNHVGTVELLLACLHAGLTVVPVNWHLTAREIAHVLDDSGSRALVVETAHAATAAQACARVPRIGIRLVLGTEAVSGFAPAEPLLAAADGTEPVAQTTGSFMLYTSGTTGAPKGVDNGLFVVGAPFSRARRTAAYARDVLGVPAGGRVLLDGPWHHSSQLFFSLLPLLLGSTLVVRSRFDPARTLETIDRERITAAHFVPTQFVRLLRLADRERAGFAGAHLTRVWHGSGPCSPEVKRRMIEWWGPVLTEYYGATEGGAVTTIDSLDWLRRPGSVGRALPSYDLVVVDADGQPLPPGGTGRVFVRRRGGRSTFHYHNAPEKTRSAHLAPGTFTFGELGHVDEDGFLFLSGRAQDLVVCGGVNVYPAEVESVLTRHPAVLDAAVLGVPDEEFGERVVAVVEAGPGAGPGLPAALDAHCRRELAGFKVPRAYHLVDALPREATGKLRKDVLRATLAVVAREAA